MGKILIYDSDDQILNEFKKHTTEKNIDIQLVSRLHDLLSIIINRKYNAIIINLDKKISKGEISCVELIKIIKNLDPTLPIIATTDGRSFENEKKARTAGIFFYMVKPFNSTEIHSILNEVIHKS